MWFVHPAKQSEAKQRKLDCFESKSDKPCFYEYLWHHHRYRPFCCRSGDMFGESKMENGSQINGRELGMCARKSGNEPFTFGGMLPFSLLCIVRRFENTKW
jgi:hypothetical protein